MSGDNTGRSPPEALQGKNKNHVPWLLRRVWDRVNKRNEHFMGIVVGREGSGKSHTAIRIAEEVDPTFSHDRVIFDVVELLEILKDGDHEPGNFYVLDEAGVQMGNRTWQDRSQILANQALQLIRDHNLGLVFTLPRFKEFDSQAAGRIQAQLEITGKEVGSHVVGRWKWLDPNRTDRDGQIYKKYPRRYMNGSEMRVKKLKFTPPSEEVIEPYEGRKREFQKEHYEEVIDEMKDGVEESEEDDDLTPKQIADKLSKEGFGHIVALNKQTNQPYVNKQLIRAEFGLSHSDAGQVKALLERQYDEEDLEGMA